MFCFLEIILETYEKVNFRKRKLMFFTIVGSSTTIFSTIPTEYCYHDAYFSVRDLTIFRKVEMLTPECYE